MSIREIFEGEQEQGTDESIVYTLNVNNWGSSPSSPSVAVYSLKKDGDYDDIDADVTSTVMPSGSASVNGDVITWPALTSLTKGVTYRMEMKFTISGNVFEAYAIIKCER